MIFQFEGVYKNAVVSINGQKAASCSYGYRPFSICVDAYLVEGENTITVECENVEQPDSRWYTAPVSTVRSRCGPVPKAVWSRNR